MASRELRTLLNTPGVLLRLAGAHDVLGAKLAEAAGFDGIWASSLEISTSCGCADDDAVTMTHVLPAASSMAACVRIPVVADVGTGGRTRDQAARMVRRFEAAGAAAVAIEDAQYPKRNSLLPGEHNLAPVQEFADKIDAAKRAQRDPGFVVIARVEALVAQAGFQEALWRAREYVAAGADAILIHSKADTPDEVLAFIDAWDSPVPLVLVPTTYHALTVRHVLRARKVRMVIYANQAMRAAIRAMKGVLRQILVDGTSHHVESRVATLAEVFELQDDFKRERALPPRAHAAARLTE